MADLANNIRLAVDSGKTAIGVNSVLDSIKRNSAKLVIITSKNKPDDLQEIAHIAKIAGIEIVKFDGDSMRLGAVCGKPYSVAAVSIIEAGNSEILNAENR
jgi:large subunit ribosomal protein L30e